nr:uncharacterized protein LOC113460534 [Zonotrichia albicollis]
MRKFGIRLDRVQLLPIPFTKGVLRDFLRGGVFQKYGFSWEWHIMDSQHGHTSSNPGLISRGLEEFCGPCQQQGLGALGRSQIQRLDLFLIPSGAWAGTHPNSTGSWEWFGNGIVPIPGAVSPLGMGLSPSQGQCHLWEWDCPIPGAVSPLGMGLSPSHGQCHLWEWVCPHPRGGVTFGNGVVPIPGAVSPLGMGLSPSQGQCHLWEWDCPHPRGNVTFGNGIVPIPGAVSPLGMGLSPSQGRCRLWEWGCPHPRGNVTFGNGIVPSQGWCHLCPGECLPKSWMEFWESQDWDWGVAVSTLRVTTGLSLPGDTAGGSWQGVTHEGHPWDSSPSSVRGLCLLTLT